MAEALDSEPFVALDDDAPFTINDLPKGLLVSIFVAANGLRWVIHIVPCVCKYWAELYRSQDASPPHEMLEVDFLKEAVATAQDARRRGLCPVARAAGQERALRSPVVHPRESPHGPRGAPTGSASCTSGGNAAEFRRIQIGGLGAGSSPLRGLL